MERISIVVRMGEEEEQALDKALVVVLVRCRHDGRSMCVRRLIDDGLDWV